MSSPTLFLFILPFLFACATPKHLVNIKHHRIESSRKINAYPILSSQDYVRISYKVTPLGLGNSDGKGILIRHGKEQFYLFAAINDDRPMAIWDSRTKQIVAERSDIVEIGKSYQFAIDLTPEGLVVYQKKDGNWHFAMSYATQLLPPFNLALQCQRSGAVFESVLIKPNHGVSAVPR